MNINMNNIATYLGCVVLIGFILYIMTNMLSINNKVIEGLTSSSSKTPEELLELLKNTKQNLVDNLHVAKYKTQYHELLLNAEDILHLKLFEQFKSSSLFRV